MSTEQFTRESVQYNATTVTAYAWQTSLLTAGYSSWAIGDKPE